MSPEPIRAVTCQTWGFLSLRRADVMECCAIAVAHLEQAGHAEPNGITIHPLDAAARLETA